MILGLSPLTKRAGVCVILRLPAVPASSLSPPVHSEFKINTASERDLECIV